MTRPPPASKIAHVWLVAGYEPDQLRSMERYLRLVTRALETDNIPHTVCRPLPILGKSWIPGSLRRLLGHIDKYLLFPWLLRLRISWVPSHHSHLVHVLDQGNALFLTALAPFRTVVTCHDFIAMRSALGLGPHPKPSIMQRTMLHFLRKARAWICVSHETRRHALSLLQAPAERCHVVHNPLDPDFEVPAEGARACPDPYLVHVGNSAWYKNRAGLLRIYHALRSLSSNPPRLLLMGQPLSEPEGRLLQELNLQDHVDICLHPSDRQVASAYANAEALVFPSLEEGFGWPPLEAMACGCPVFASNLPPLTEIGGDAAEYFDPGDPAAAAALIGNRLSLGRAWRAERSHLGRARAAAFSPDNFATHMMEAYQLVAQDLPKEGRDSP